MDNLNSGTNMPQNVKKYVYAGTIIINIVLFACQIFYGLIFWKYDAKILLYYNYITTVTFIFACIMLKLKRIRTYVLITFAGIFGLMIMAVIFLGWDYGFQQYCIGFVASIIFTGFYMSRQRKISKTTSMLVVVNVMLYVGMRLWTYEHPYVYELGNVWLKRGFYIMNSLLGFVFLIGYSFIYTRTVQKLEKSLREMANIDPLTGICNRRKMHQILKNSLENNDKIPYQAVVTMLDVDHFKKVNDTYGHDVGDEVLLMLAKLLYDEQENIPGFYVSRWGGEEFLVFYEKYSQTEEEIIEKFDDLRKKISDTVVISNNKQINITVTMGLAFYEEGESIQKLIKIADDNLYRGKNAGRNRVVASN